MDRDVLDALLGELREGETDLADALAEVSAADATQQSVSANAARYCEFLRRFGNAAEMLDLPSLKELVAFFESNARGLAEAPVTERTHEERQDLFSQWPKLLGDFLAKPADPATLGHLMRRVQDPAWPMPMDEEAAVDLAERLLGEVAGEPSEAEAQSHPESTRAKQAQVRDVELGFSDDINPQLINAFLHEAPQHINRLSRCVQRIAAGEAGIEDIMQAQRVAHTLKGSANTIGVSGIGNLTHHMEDILEFLAARGELPPPGLGDTLQDASDCLEMMVEHLLGIGAVPENALGVLQRLLDWANRIDSGEYRAAAPEKASRRRVEKEATSEPAEPDTGRLERTATPAAQAPSPSPGAEGVVATALRVAVETIDDLLRLAGEMATSIVQIRGRQERTLDRVNALTEQHALVAQRLGALQDLVHVRGVPAHRRALLEAVGSSEADFDPLELDEYSELHSATNAFAEALTDARELTDELRNELVDLEGMMGRHEQVSAELNEAVLAARLVPVESIVSRLQRGVRQTCRVTGKRARLRVTGAEMLVDSEILNNVVDPLMHIVRNAVDHGIEPPGERVATGKDEQGDIALSFVREGENVVIRCRDDGGGFDFVRIRELAVNQGIVKGDRHLNEAELARLALIPGFTTRRGTTQVSGRGIGLDVVHRSILDLRGSMDVESSPGKGSEITLRVPLTLISMHVLLVRVGERIYGVPSSTLEQALFSDAGPVVHTESDWIFRFADTDYALRTLSDLVGLAGAQVSSLAERVAPLLLCRGDTGPVGVMVDELVDGRYLVVKRLGTHVPRVRGVIGASILADGSVAPVLDLRELMRLPAIPEITIDLEAFAEPVVAATNAPNVLVVDDSLSARRTLAQVITDAGYEARTAVDGLDAIEAIEERTPDLILLDLEMPRMNGLELASHLRADDTTRDIPLVMITSRSTAKHREQAHAAGIDAFITKPYQEDEVAEQIRLLIPNR